MAWERLNPLDESFLLVENERHAMQVGAMVRLEGAPLRREDGVLDRDRIIRHLQGRLDEVPRFRRRVRPVPLHLGRPVWADDPHFHLPYHVRFTGLPRPGGDAEMRELTAQIMAAPLDRDRPLWEMHWVDGLRDDQVGLVWKTHHSLIDGVSGVEVATMLFDLDPEVPDPPQPAPWTPAPEPHPIRLAAEAVGERLAQPREWARTARELLRRPRAAALALRDEVRGLTPFGDDGLLAPKTCLNVPIGPHRRFATASMPLDAFRAVTRAWGGTINDVALNVVAGAFRSFFRQRGEPVEGVQLHVMIPVSVRTGTEWGTLGNRVSMLSVALPLDRSDPQVRHRTISRATGEHKRAHQAESLDALLQVPGFFPPAVLLHGAARLQGAQRFLNTVVTNVPGPQFPLYACGARVLEMHPCIPLGPNLAVDVGLLSYDGALSFGLMGDYDAMPDLDRLADDLQRSFMEIQGAAAGRA